MVWICLSVKRMSKENGTEKWESMGDLFIELFFFYICRVVYIVLLI